MLQVDQALIDAFHKAGFEIAIETNGTLPVLDEIDWICVSPKAGAPIRQRSGDELKLVYPQPDMKPEDVLGLSFTHFLLQPLDDQTGETANLEAALKYCLRHPRWRLSLQTHKILGLP
jgi:organic radical activating enzyme